MKRFFVFALLAMTSLFLACEPEYPFGGDDTNGDDTPTTQEPIPVPKPEEPEPEEPENPTPEEPTPAEVTATLTYDECKSLLVKSYGNPKSYTNSYGTWTICVYDNSNAMQINSSKVAYIGTPKFEGDIKKITLRFAESYSKSIYLCSEAGTTSVAGQFESFKCGGTAQEYTLTTKGVNRLYIRSEACARIASITIVAGGSGSGNSGGTTPEPEPENPTPEPEPEPTPDPTPVPNPSTMNFDWAELPVVIDENNDGRVDSDTSLYYAWHLCAGGEKNAQRNDTARNFTVCYSAEHHCPLWVAAPMHSCYHGSSGRNNAYRQDPKIPSNIQYSSTSIGGGCNKGHMLSSHDRTSSVATNKQVFYYTNISPQDGSNFNTGGGWWNNMEEIEKNEFMCSDTLYTVHGCHWTNKNEKFNKQTVPTHFYKVFLRTKKGNSGKWVVNCSASELQCVAFYVSHYVGKVQPSSSHMISVAELERITGHTFFPNVPNAPKDTFNPSDWGM